MGLIWNKDWYDTRLDGPMGLITCGRGGYGDDGLAGSMKVSYGGGLGHSRFRGWVSLGPGTGEDPEPWGKAFGGISL